MEEAIPPLKRCYICRERLPLEAFSRHRGNSDGRATRCKACDAAYKKAWYAQNRERLSERNRQLYQGEYREQAIARAQARYERDPEAWNANQRARRAANPEAARAKERAYRKANAERVKAWKRAEYERDGAKIRAKHAEWYAADPAKFIGRVIEWQQRNPDLVRLKVGRYKARKLAATVGEVTPEGLIGKLAYWGWACHLCGGKFGEVTDWDHVKPLAKGGAHVLANLRPACDHCNSRKKARWPYPIRYAPAR
jgi:5-methylcytosine-specific restriction endonuclease McrA